MPKKKSAPKRQGAIEVGFFVAVALEPDSAPLRCYVGQVQALDDVGMRITLMDWIMGEPTGFDLFVPWSTIRSALVATPEHDYAGFLGAASQFQTAVNATEPQEQR